MKKIIFMAAVSAFAMGLVLFGSLFTSCIKEPPCPRNLQKVEFVLDSAHVSLADYISMEPGDEVVVFETVHFSLERPSKVDCDKTNAIQRKFRFDGELFVPLDGQGELGQGKNDYYYCVNEIKYPIQILMYDDVCE